ncbi:MAG: hypothetical protein JSS02_03875 [Planctomycetes bacterium]|nr:hypothetical protein [Planctomycetota bacterium]
MIGDEQTEETGESARQSTIDAIRTIFVADFAMSLDNMLAVAGASRGDWIRLLLGLAISITIIMTSSSIIARLMNRFKWLVNLGAMILAYTAADMLLHDQGTGNSLAWIGYALVIALVMASPYLNRLLKRKNAGSTAECHPN